MCIAARRVVPSQLHIRVHSALGSYAAPQTRTRHAPCPLPLTRASSAATSPGGWLKSTPLSV